MLTRRGIAELGAVAAFTGMAGSAQAAVNGAAHIHELQGKLSRLPAKRDFISVPQVLDAKEQWDDGAIREVAAYRGGPKQIWDNKDLNSGWLGFMRNALNGQVVSFGAPDFFTVSMTRGDAQLALFDQATWDKYQLAKLTGGKMTGNNMITPVDAPGGRRAYDGSTETFALQDSSITTLMRRGVVFMACHNAIWTAASRAMANANPDKLTLEQVAAEMTNHLLPGVILTPGALATLPVLQQAGFNYVT